MLNCDFTSPDWQKMKSDALKESFPVDFWSSYCPYCSLLSVALPPEVPSTSPSEPQSVLPQLSETTSHCLWRLSFLYSRLQWTCLQQNVSWDNHWAHLDFPFSAITVWDCLLSNTRKQLFNLSCTVFYVFPMEGIYSDSCYCIVAENRNRLCYTWLSSERMRQWRKHSRELHRASLSLSSFLNMQGSRVKLHVLGKNDKGPVTEWFQAQAEHEVLTKVASPADHLRHLLETVGGSDHINGNKLFLSKDYSGSSLIKLKTKPERLTCN